MVGDGSGAGVVAGGEQALAEAKDARLGLGVDLVSAAAWPSRAGLEGLVASFAKASDELVDPASGEPVLPGQLSRAPALQQHSIDHVAT